MEKIINKLNQAYILLLIIMAVIVMMLGIYQVLGRYILGLPIYWTEESIRYLHNSIVFCGIGFVAQSEAFTTITLVSDIIAKKSKVGVKIQKIAHRLLQLIFFLLLLYWGGRLTLHAAKQHQVSAAAKFPFSIIYAALPLGGLLGATDAVLKMKEIIDLD
jgi:TRAP-type C4-dicarboxylate transport system permease small subunit